MDHHLLGLSVLGSFAALGAFSLISRIPVSEKEIDHTVYEKKPYLFDTSNEFKLYKLLLELFGNGYHVLPQINYSHLLVPKSKDKYEARGHRSRIDKKSADFVICDKDTVVPVLVIELDGYVHNYAHKKARDAFIDGVGRVVGLPILHINNADLSRDFVKSEVERILAVNSSK